MRDLTAIKPLIYANRRLLPGEDFTARTVRDANVLIALRKARRAVPDEQEVTPVSEDGATPDRCEPLDHDGDGGTGGSVAPETSADLKVLRAQYQEIVGKKPFAGWDAEELRRRITAAE